MISKLEAKDRFQGVVVPLATVFNDDLSLDVQGTVDNAQWIVDRGAKQGNTVFLIAGSGGDFTALNMEERKQVIEAVAKVGRDNDVPMMAGVQSTDIRDTITLCKLSEDQGVEIAQISGAYYYTVQAEDTIAWHEEVAKHTNIGFSAYSHWYSGSKYDLPVDVVERLMDLPNTILVKWGSPSIENFMDGVRRFLPRVPVVDNGPIPIFGHILGCRAFISHVPNYYPHHAWKVWDLMEAQRYKEAQDVYDGFMVRYRTTRIQSGGRLASFIFTK